MKVLSRVRLLAFLAILAGGLMVLSASAFDPIECPDQGCGYCPARWSGPCYIPHGQSTTCGDFGCYSIGSCSADGYDDNQRCYCDPCSAR